ncbi:hypothetical protein C6568_09430 [Melaminivora suipulveris]|uniref:DUF2799 domain-containing protein n=1 Tax=Melaminivora suipulveris TaxID=2109913 RepID=A0A2R3QCP4_9BURK|nr:DUF2799 domain-containing protein [Melaminivora suipulveris]AVO49464.1 hypothetical protein C6568_09430 [Melaminivora suipulveris]
MFRACALRRPAAPAASARRLLRLSVLGAALALLAGCAAMSEQECRTADWREQGLRDALDGQPRSRLADIHDACAKAGVRPVDGLYLDGWSRGLSQFCTPDNGARWGRQGRSYANSCPPELEAAFSDRYRAGRRAWDAEQAVKRLQGEQRDRQRALDQAKDDAARRQARDQLRALDWRLRDAREELDRAEWSLRQPY